MIKKILVLSAVSLFSNLSFADDYLWTDNSNSNQEMWIGLGADYISTNFEGQGFDPFAIQLQLQYQSNNWRHELYGSTGFKEDTKGDTSYRLNAAYGYMIGFSEKLDNELIATLSAGIGVLNRTISSPTAKNSINNYSPVWKFSLEESIKHNSGWRMFLEGGGYYEGEKNRTLHVSLGIKHALSF